ncbi:MAG: OmpH family outer membrane protein [Candidatus Eremiobacteraeota bacterium]|nr:OmpH family outer membrane protein [Candidatus Eremiobacteraeota bacterium]
MSKMLSTSSRKAFATLSFCAAVLSGCGVDVHSSAVRGVGYVRMNDVLKQHPLYPQLAQLDDAIAAINLAAAAPHVPLSASQIAHQTQLLNVELQQAQDRAQKILAEKQTEYAQREQKAIVAALQAAGIKGAGAYAAQNLSATSQQQAQAAAQAANSDFAAYQQSMISQSNAAGQAIVGQLQTQAQQKIRAKAEQLQQNETDLSLRLTQQDAAQRLAIKTRLSNLALDDATHKQLQAQMAAIDAKEASQVNAQRRADAATLSAYRDQVGAETNAAIRSQLGSIQSETRAKLVERQNEVGQQIRSLGPQPLPTNLPPDVSAKLVQIHKQVQAQFQADAQSTISDYNATKADLDRQFQALHGADVGATGAAAKELGSLQKRRDDLYKDIVDQITRQAQRIGKDRGFSIVFINPNAAAGGYDLTNDLVKDVESLHE